MTNDSTHAAVLVQPSEDAANDGADKKNHLRRYPTNGPYQYEPFDWARVAQEEGIEPRP